MVSSEIRDDQDAKKCGRRGSRPLQVARELVLKDVNGATIESDIVNGKNPRNATVYLAGAEGSAARHGDEAGLMSAIPTAKRLNSTAQGRRAAAHPGSADRHDSFTLKALHTSGLGGQLCVTPSA